MRLRVEHPLVERQHVVLAEEQPEVLERLAHPEGLHAVAQLHLGRARGRVGVRVRVRERARVRARVRVRVRVRVRLRVSA